MDDTLEDQIFKAVEKKKAEGMSQEAAQEAVERELLANAFPKMIRGPLSHRLHWTYGTTGGWALLESEMWAPSRGGNVPLYLISLQT